MEDLDEFKKLLRQIMSKECKPLYSKEVIDQAAREIEVLQLVENRHVIWMN